MMEMVVVICRTLKHTYHLLFTHTPSILMPIFPREPGLAGYPPLNSPLPFIPKLHILLGQA